MHPEEQQDREQHDKQTEGNTTCADQKRPLLGESCIDPAGRSIRLLTSRGVIGSHKIAGKRTWLDRSLAEKPKVGELQMNWLRSEDLKEEKNVTAPTCIIAGQPAIRLSHRKQLVGGRTLN